MQYFRFTGATPLHSLRRAALFVLILIVSAVGPARATPLLLVDMDNLDVLQAEDAGAAWHPASLTKLMTAFVAFEQIALGRMSLDTTVTLSRNAVSQPPSKSELPVDTALRLEDALYILLVKSANDIAVAIAETVGGSEAGFVGQMNDAARRMGMSATHFTNAHGLHDAAQVTSARDLAVLSLYILQTYPQYAPMFATETVRLGNRVYESQNALLTGFQGTTGMKTGYVCASGLNLVATAERNGRRLLAVVLGASSGRERNERAAEMLLRGVSARGTGQSLLQLVNQPGQPVNMRPMICGAESQTYVAARQAEFPMGLAGQPSYLNDEIPGRSYMAADLGRIRTGIPLPRPRPAHLPVATTVMASNANVELSGPVDTSRLEATIPFPRPRPHFRSDTANPSDS